MNSEGQFVAIRMIILEVEEDRAAAGPSPFVQFMKFDAGTGEGFLDIMGRFFSDAGRGLERLVFLKGNKREHALQSNQASPPKTPAGANADYAWITYWEDEDHNRIAWDSVNPADRPAGWYGANGLWKTFLNYCYHKTEAPLLTFSMDLAYAAALNAGNVAVLRNVFHAEGGVPLSNAANPPVNRGGGKWEITDGAQVYFVEQGPTRIYVRYSAQIPKRPEHGSPYDYLGHPSLAHNHFGKGAGALVAGFDIIYDRFRTDYHPPKLAST